MGGGSENENASQQGFEKDWGEWGEASPLPASGVGDRLTGALPTFYAAVIPAIFST